MKKIGWKEKVSFPEFGLVDIPAKIDTGARTSVLHCQSIEIIKRYRKSYVKFVLLDPQSPQYNGAEFVLPFHKERKVKNSFGQEENRIVIETVVELYNKKYPIELSLRDRSNMEFPMLLGRSFIRRNFIVDVSRSNLSARYKKKKLKEKLERENRHLIKK
ncbi:MAG: RimK/LysX family protein [Bacteroidota bacterium]|nr:RimK/LysX family protein [Bacteroidota bacterium]MDX5429891.1 RimK/LysX family protein [Bacteroidota bacterium]MDX5468665.1 RimK/LysX family protein [Bacteroidota bacterium]